MAFSADNVAGATEHGEAEREMLLFMPLLLLYIARGEGASLHSSSNALHSQHFFAQQTIIDILLYETSASLYIGRFYLN